MDSSLHILSVQLLTTLAHGTRFLLRIRFIGDRRNEPLEVTDRRLFHFGGERTASGTGGEVKRIRVQLGCQCIHLIGEVFAVFRWVCYGLSVLVTSILSVVFAYISRNQLMATPRALLTHVSLRHPCEWVANGESLKVVHPTF